MSTHKIGDLVKTEIIGRTLITTILELSRYGVLVKHPDYPEGIWIHNNDFDLITPTQA